MRGQTVRLSKPARQVFQLIDKYSDRCLGSQPSPLNSGHPVGSPPKKLQQGVHLARRELLGPVKHVPVFIQKVCKKVEDGTDADIALHFLCACQPDLLFDLRNFRQDPVELKILIAMKTEDRPDSDTGAVLKGVLVEADKAGPGLAPVCLGAVAEASGAACLPEPLI